jgi:signal transduction histidine kinase/CheY-like chemotaxis protein/HAMP domain-containing protein
VNLPAAARTLRNSFLFRLVLRFTLVAGAVTLLVSTLYVRHELRENRKNAESMARLTAMAVAESARLPLFAGNREELARLVRLGADNPVVRRISILDPAKKVVADAGAPDPGLPVLTLEVRGSHSAGSPVEVLTGEGKPPDTPIGTVRVEFEPRSFGVALRNIVLVAGGAALLFLLLVSLLSFPVLRRTLRSFDRLLEGLGAIREGDYDRVLPAEPGSEIGVAARNVNDLAQALKRRDELNRALRGSLEEEIREHARAETEAREGERTLRELMDAMPVGVAWTDPGGNVQFMNRCATDLFGRGEFRTAEEWFTQVCPEPAEREKAMASRADARGEGRRNGSAASSCEVRVSCGDGAVRHVIFTNLLRKDRLVTTMVDITERDAMQERVVRGQKMETLGILAGGIAHNFNNALTAVLGYVGYAHSKLDDPAKAAELLGKAEEAGVAAARIAGQLLTFARGGEPVKEPLSVARVLRNALSLSLVGTRVEASVRIPEGIHGVEADEGQLSQVFNNLLINAVQSMPEGGSIEVRCANRGADDAPPKGLPPGNYVEISVEDRGCGIPKEMLGKIFDPYFTTKAEVGRGLGLASVRSIVERHGGSVAVRSEVGRGTVFTLHLPSTGTAGPEEPDRGNGSAPLEMKGVSILFLDDEAPIRNLVRETLEHFGCRVTTCARGEEAILLYQEAKAHGTPFSATVLDLTIPNGMGGRETASRILALDPDAVLVVTSGYSNDPVMADHRKYGFRAAVPKPYRDNALTRTIDRLRLQGDKSG